MKRICLAAGLGLFALGAQAQLTRGVTAGYHLADVRVSFNPLIDPTFTPVATGRAGYHAGGFYRASAGLFYAQPQVWLTGLNQQFIIEDGSFPLKSSTGRCFAWMFPSRWALSSDPCSDLWRRCTRSRWQRRVG